MVGILTSRWSIQLRYSNNQTYASPSNTIGCFWKPLNQLNVSVWDKATIRQCAAAAAATTTTTTTCSTVLPEKLTGPQPVKKLPAFYWTRRFITAFTTARHMSLSWARSMQSLSSHPTSRRSISISSHPRLGLPSGSFPQVFPSKSSMRLYSPPHVLHAPPIPVFLIRSPKWYFVRSTEHKAPCFVVFSEAVYRNLKKQNFCNCNCWSLRSQL